MRSLGGAGRPRRRPKTGLAARVPVVAAPGVPWGWSSRATIDDYAANTICGRARGVEVTVSADPWRDPAPRRPQAARVPQQRLSSTRRSRILEARPRLMRWRARAPLGLLMRADANLHDPTSWHPGQLLRPCSPQRVCSTERLSSRATLPRAHIGAAVPRRGHPGRAHAVLSAPPATRTDRAPSGPDLSSRCP